MALADLTREAVLKAIEEFDRLGRADFLSKYGFKEARHYFLEHDGKRYDSKAIAGVAHGFLEGRKPLRPSEFSGGDRTVKTTLGALGFTVTSPGLILPAPAPLVEPPFLTVASPGAARLPGRPYEAASESQERSPAAPFEVDPDAVDRGTRAHARTQNALAAFLQHQGCDPRSPDRANGEPEFDVAWTRNDRIYVAEVKSITPANEEKQLRLGLGQVLRYRQQLRGWHLDVVGVLVAERQPTDQAWPDLCRELTVILAWGEDFETIPTG
jgi:hypothetical protein